MSQHSSIQMATVAQKMINILAMSCPANYHCGGPAYGASAAMDVILHLMGIGVAMLQKTGNSGYEEEFQKYILESAVCGNSIIGQYVQHKGQILASALHAIVSNVRDGSLRETQEVTENALMSLLQWYFVKAGASKEEFWKKFQEGAHDELIQLEKASRVDD